MSNNINHYTKSNPLLLLRRTIRERGPPTILHAPTYTYYYMANNKSPTDKPANVHVSCIRTEVSLLLCVVVVLLLLSSYSSPHIRVCCSFSMFTGTLREMWVWRGGRTSSVLAINSFLGTEHQHVGLLNHI